MNKKTISVARRILYLLPLLVILFPTPIGFAQPKQREVVVYLNQEQNKAKGLGAGIEVLDSRNKEQGIYLVPESELPKLKAKKEKGEIDSYSYNGLLHVSNIPDDTLYGDQWALPKISAPTAWDTTTGSALVTIAIIDTGFKLDHPDLASRFMAGFDFVGNDSDPSIPAIVNPEAELKYAHGTMVSGFAAAVTNNAMGVAGLDWNAKIMPLRVCNNIGSCYLDDVASAVSYATTNGADVINLSLGGPDDYDPLEAVINNAVAAGITVVVASGNENTAVSYPAKYDSVIAVGATDSSDVRASFSNYGPELDVVAPGSSVKSTAPWWNGTAFVDTYATGGGTSYASPYVSGLAALIASTGSYSPAVIKAKIIDGADKVAGMGGQNFTNYYGYGRIDAAAAVTSEVGELHHINIAPNTTQNITAGQTVIFTAQGQDINNNDIYGPTYTWTGTSSSSSGLFNNSTPGTYQVKASSGGIDSTAATVNVAAAPAPIYAPVYRFYNMKNGAHFYTANEAEKNNVIANYSATYKFEGAVYQINISNVANSKPLYRLWNTTGSHFYTVSYEEAINATIRWPSKYKYEGPVYNVSLDFSGVPVYRFYNMKNGTHFYTANEAEKNNVIASWPTIFKYEGIGYYLGQ